LRRSGEIGFAFAQALMAGVTQGDERVKFAQLSAAQGERDGYAWLGWTGWCVMVMAVKKRTRQRIILCM
jgi:hypothetical protein